MKHSNMLLLAASILNVSIILAHSDVEKDTAMKLDVTSFSQAASTLSLIYRRGISIEMGPETETVPIAATIQARAGAPAMAISELTSLLDHYVSEEDASTGMINIFPRVGSRLNWQLPNAAVTNMTISKIFEDDVFGFKQHGITFFPGRGNLSWLDHKISVTEADSISARRLLNRICAELPFKARWELRIPRAGSDALLTFHGYDKQPTRNETVRDKLAPGAEEI